MNLIDNIISAWAEETNPFANSTFANNGGGYSQPYSGYILDMGGRVGLLCVEVEDYSCGDFGTRVNVEIDVPAVQMRWSVCIGTMDDTAIDDPEEVEDVENSILGVTGLGLGDLIALGREVADVCCYRRL